MVYEISRIHIYYNSGKFKLVTETKDSPGELIPH